MANRTGLLLLGAVSLAACSTIVGADFDDKSLGTPSTGGSSDLNGGSAALGGQATGSAPSGSGGTPTGGTPSTNSAGSGGTTIGSGGTSSGGRGGGSGAAGSGGGSGGVTSGGSGGMGNGQGGTTVVGSGGQDMAGAGAGGEPQAGAGGAGGDPGTNGGAGAGGAGGAGGDGGSGPSGPPVVVLNEIRGQGEGSDFIEIYNRGPGALALGGYGLSDENNTFIFPAGASIAERGYVLLLLNRTDLGGAYQCYTTNPCYHAGWGVSKDRGEWVYFRGLQNQVLDSIRYPATGEPGALSGSQSLSRFPNGTGDFRATAPTPERANDTL